MSKISTAGWEYIFSGTIARHVTHERLMRSISSIDQIFHKCEPESSCRGASSIPYRVVILKTPSRPRQKKLALLTVTGPQLWSKRSRFATLRPLYSSVLSRCGRVNSNVWIVTGFIIGLDSYVNVHLSQKVSQYILIYHKFCPLLSKDVAQPYLHIHYPLLHFMSATFFHCRYNLYFTI